MSLRYTGEATMDGPALRDVEHWKDKIEVRLDNRQVFFLFFGSAMVACMLFVLGVIVGKRLESRGRAEAPAVEDPLAVLDRFGAQPTAAANEALTFPKSLLAGSGPNRGKTAARENRSLTKPTLTATAPTPAVSGGAGILVPLKEASDSAPPTGHVRNATPTAPQTPPIAAAEGSARSRSGAAPSDATVDEPTLAPAPVAAKKLAALPRPLAPSAKAQPPVAPAAPSSTSSKSSTVATLPSVSPAKAAGAPSVSEKDKGKGHFLLQLSSFQDRAEAEAFARKFPGKNAYVVATDLPGKGTWYRVRVGNYGTMQEAGVAKATFEREHNVIAYVAGTGPAK